MLKLLLFILKDICAFKNETSATHFKTKGRGLLTTVLSHLVFLNIWEGNKMTICCNFECKLHLNWIG